ncbi:MAG TPA: chemotaxis protein CheA [Longimicrobiaceae bacterium]
MSPCHLIPHPRPPAGTPFVSSRSCPLATAAPHPEELLADPFDLSSLLGEFRDEAREQLDRLDAALLTLEDSGALPPEDTTALLRALHTLKGNSGMLGLRPLVDAVHALEEVFKEAPPAFLSEQLDSLFEAAAAVRQAVEQAGSEGQQHAFARLARLDLGVSPPAASFVDTAPSSPSPSAGASGRAGDHAEEHAADHRAGDEPDSHRPGSKRAPEHTEAEPSEAAGEYLRVSFAKLDELLDQVGELTSVTAALEALLEEREDGLRQAGVERPLGELVEQLGRVSRALRTSTMDARLVPVQRVFSRFPSLARDLAREQGKRVRVVLRGGEVELDRSMVDALGDPLLHLVRNAVDHGVRLPAEREAAGKPPTGTIVLRAERQGDRVRVEVMDDGPGLDPAALRERARALGLLSPDAEPSDEELAELIFLPGFSTRASSDTVSGRGIGLDVVKQRIVALRGQLSVEMRPEGGTRFVLDLPLTLAILPALIFEAGGATLAFPAVSVEGTLRGIAPERAGATEVLRLEDGLVPVARAERIFGWHERSAADDGTGGATAPFAVVVRSGSRRAAVLASRLLEQRDLVVKAMPHYLGRLPGVFGASVSPDGRVILLLDPAGLLDLNLAHHQRENRAFIAPQNPRRRG